MPVPTALCRAPCCASTSRSALVAARRCRPTTATTTSSPAPVLAARLSLLAHRPPPFFSPPPGLASGSGNGNGKHAANGDKPPSEPTPSGTPSGSPSPSPSPSPEAEVDDREWEMRVARAMLHLREALPLLFTDTPAKELFPDDIYSKNVVLRLPHPFPIKISSLHGYSVAFNIARNGMQALHTDLNATLERMTFSPAPSPSSPQAAVRETLLGKAPTHRQKQIRVLLSVTGKPRLPPHKDATWHTSSLYTFSPYSGLIASHEVETIRPLPGEGVSEWLMKSLLGWTGRRDAEGAIPVPRAVEVQIEEPIVHAKKKEE